MFINSGKITSTQGKEPPLMTTREELKKDDKQRRMEKFITKSCRRTEEDWQKKIARATNP